MKIHEYQAKALIKEFNVPVKDGVLVEDLNQVEEAYNSLNSPVVAVKAQIHAGGRGKGGGVKIAKNLNEAKEYASNILGMNLVTHQTGPEGQKVRKIYIEQGTSIAKEMYLAVLLNREEAQLTIVAAGEGGMEIEELAKTNPEKICKLLIDSSGTFTKEQSSELCKGLGLDSSLNDQVFEVCGSLINAYITLDASLVEINPLVLTEDKTLVALDAKMTFDDNALYRQAKVTPLQDINEEDPLELEAAKHGLSYISLDGSVGCMVNGAGLAMATMDVIKLAGLEPANFLDVGGGATEEAVTEAFKIILKDKKVKAILVNIFGGIMQCDIIANGVVAAAKATNLSLPLVVRLQGTNAIKGRKILAESGLTLTTAETIGEAADKVVSAARNGDAPERKAG
jgi:succinyl-CoA synthetase beta subunit